MKRIYRSSVRCIASALSSLQMYVGVTYTEDDEMNLQEELSDLLKFLWWNIPLIWTMALFSSTLYSNALRSSLLGY